jgi:hypothetical protein
MVTAELRSTRPSAAMMRVLALYNRRRVLRIGMDAIYAIVRCCGIHSRGLSASPRCFGWLTPTTISFWRMSCDLFAIR